MAIKGMDKARLADAKTHIDHHVSLEDRLDKIEDFLFTPKEAKTPRRGRKEADK